MKKNCVLCSKSKTKYHEVDVNIICNTCAKNDDRLYNLLTVYYNRQSESKSRSMEQNGDAISYSQDLKKEDKSFEMLHSYVSSLKSETDKKEQKKKNILNKIQQMNSEAKEKFISDTNNQNIIDKLNAFSSEELDECAESIEKASDIQDFSDNSEIKTIKHNLEVPDPKELFSTISLQVIDQEDAVKAVSIALTKHMCRLIDPEIKKNNIMIIGPTGTGKTELVRIFAKVCKNIPVLTLDSSSFTAIGYKGSSVDETIASGLLGLTNWDMALARRAIVFLDEIDKKASIHSQDSADIGTVQVQQQLLKIIEGGELRVQIPGKTGNLENVVIDTTNILFVCAGAFSGLEKILNKGTVKKMSLTDGPSLVREIENSFKNVTNKHLEQYGLIPEFLGRFGTITYTKLLSKESLIKILNKPQNSISDSFKKLFSQYQCNLVFTTEFIDEIAAEAESQGIGARGLDRIFEVKMEKYVFDIVNYVGKVLTVDAQGKSTVGKKIKVISI